MIPIKSREKRWQVESYQSSCKYISQELSTSKQMQNQKETNERTIIASSFDGTVKIWKDHSLIDGVVIMLHSQTCWEGSRVGKLSRKGHDWWHDDKDFKSHTGLCSSDDPVGESLANPIPDCQWKHRWLCDEKLVLDIDIMLALLDRFNISIIDTSLCWCTIRPSRSTSKELTSHASRWLRPGCFKVGICYCWRGK